MLWQFMCELSSVDFEPERFESLEDDIIIRDGFRRKGDACGSFKGRSSWRCICRRASHIALTSLQELRYRWQHKRSCKKMLLSCVHTANYCWIRPFTSSATSLARPLVPAPTLDVTSDLSVRVQAAYAEGGRRNVHVIRPPIHGVWLRDLVLRRRRPLRVLRNRSDPSLHEDHLDMLLPSLCMLLLSPSKDEERHGNFKTNTCSRVWTIPLFWNAKQGIRANVNRCWLVSRFEQDMRSFKGSEGVMMIQRPLSAHALVSRVNAAQDSTVLFVMTSVS